MEEFNTQASTPTPAEQTPPVQPVAPAEPTAPKQDVAPAQPFAPQNGAPVPPPAQPFAPQNGAPVPPPAQPFAPQNGAPVPPPAQPFAPQNGAPVPPPPAQPPFGAPVPPRPAQPIQPMQPPYGGQHTFVPPTYGQSPYGQVPPYGVPHMPQQKKNTGLGITAMILGILSIVIGCCCTYAGVLLGVVAGILAIVDRAKSPERKFSGMALAGLITGIIGFAISAITIVLVLLEIVTYDFSSFGGDNFSQGL